MNGVWSIEYGVSGIVPFQVAGGGPGWQDFRRSRGNRRPGGCCGYGGRRRAAEGRGVATPRPPCGVHDESCPYQHSPCGE